MSSSSTPPDLQDVPILLSYYSEKRPEIGKTCADLPVGFPVAKFSIGDESCLVFTKYGRRLLGLLVHTVIKYVKKGELFQKFEPKDIVSTGLSFTVREERAPKSDLGKDDYPGSDSEEDDEPEIEVGEDAQPICNLGEDDQKKYIEQMLLDVERFFLIVCGGESRVPPDLRHLLSLIKSEAGNKGFLRNYYRLLLEHPSISFLNQIENMMSCLALIFGLHNLHEVDEEAEKVLNALDTSCYPASWVDRVQKVARSDTEFNYLNEVLDVCKHGICLKLGSEKGYKILSGVKGILIFLNRLIRYIYMHASPKVNEDGVTIDKAVVRHEMINCSYYAVTLMFPNFLPGIFAAVYRSPVLRARLMEHVGIWG